MIQANHLRALGMALCVIGGLAYFDNQFIDTIGVQSRNDFKHLYLAGYLARHGSDFYDAAWMLRAAEMLISPQTGAPVAINPFVYPPFFAILLIPLSWLPYEIAWLAFNFAAHAAWLTSIGLLIACVRKPGEPASLWWGAFLCLSAAMFPLQRNFWAGQMNPFLLLSMAAAAYSIHKKNDIAAGAWLGLGAAVKVSPAFLLIYLAVKRKWAGLAAGLGVIALSLFISLILLGIEPHLQFADEARQMSYGSSTWSQYGMKFHLEPHNQAPSALWYRLFTQSEKAQGLIDSPLLAKSLSYLTALAVFAGLALLSWRQGRAYSLREFSLWIVAMLLLPSLMWDHYLAQALPALIVAVRMLVDGKTRGGLFFAFGVYLILMPFAYMNPAWSNGAGILVCAHKLYGLLFAAIFLAINPPQTEPAE